MSASDAVLDRDRDVADFGSTKIYRLRRADGNSRREDQSVSRGSRETRLVPLDQIPAAREMMLRVLTAPPAEVHQMRVRLQREYPGRTPGEVLASFRRLRDDRGARKGQHATIGDDEIRILRAGYAAGPRAARTARKEVLNRRPDLNRNIIDRIVRQLKLAAHRLPVCRWSHKDHGHLMFWSEEKSVRRLAARFNRSEAAVRTRLSRYGARARIRVHRGYTVREAAALLGVSRTAISMWMASGELERRRKDKIRTITEEALLRFCELHPEKVETRLCSPKVLRWLPRQLPATSLSGRRGHLAHTHTCPKCGRAIRGNGYSTHEKSCGRKLQSP